MQQSLPILYVEHAVARKMKYDKIISDFVHKVDRRLCTVTGC